MSFFDGVSRELQKRFVSWGCGELNDGKPSAWGLDDDEF
jgi:hypothetical protein